MGAAGLLFNLTTYNSAVATMLAVNEVLECNARTACYNLCITNQQAVELVEARSQNLIDNGRIELGGGIIDKLIDAFCSSAYLMQDNYVETIHELMEIFYYYKNETLDLVSDDDLVDYMRQSYEGICQSSTELLKGRELDRLARWVRYANSAEYEQKYGIAGGSNYE
jgi:hypothetical protein